MKCLLRLSLDNIIEDMENHIKETFPELDFVPNQLRKTMKHSIDIIYEYGINTREMIKRFLELSVVFGWDIIQREDILELLKSEMLLPYTKIVKIEDLLIGKSTQ